MPQLPQHISGGQSYTARTTALLAQGDKRLCLQQPGGIMQLHLRHHSGYTPGGEELLKIFIAQLQPHKHTAEKITGFLCQSEHHMRKQLYNPVNIGPLVLVDGFQVILLQLLTKTVLIVDCRHGTVAKIPEDLITGMITGRLFKQ